MIAMAKKKAPAPRRREGDGMVNGVAIRDAVLLRDLCKLLPDKPARGTLFRYCSRGLVSPVSGKVVKLRFVHLPRGIASTVEAYYEFIEELNQKCQSKK